MSEVIVQPGRNSAITVYESAERAEASPAVDIVNYCGQGIHIILDVTDVGEDDPEVTVVIEGKDRVSGKYYSLLSAIDPVVAVSTTVYKVAPLATAATGLAARDFVPQRIRISVEHVNTDAITYSVGLNALR